jgi:hypothetical protein
MTRPIPAVNKTMMSPGMMEDDVCAAYEHRKQESKAKTRATLKEQISDFSFWPLGSMLERYKRKSRVGW